MPRYSLRIGNASVPIASTDTALSEAVGKRLAGGTPETNVDSSGGGHRYQFGGQQITFEDLRDIKDIRDSGGQVATLMEYKALLHFGGGTEINVEADEETEQPVDGEPMTLSEWLEAQFPKLDLTILDLGEDALWYPYAVGEIQETQAGGFKQALPAEPWTMLPKQDERGEIQAWKQQTKSPSGGFTETTHEADDIWHLVVNKSSARDETGISEILRNREEIQAFKQNEQAIRKAIELHGFPQRHVKVGREEGAPVSDNDLRRVRSIFDPRTTESNTAYFTGQDVDVETLEAHNFDYASIHEMDMRNLTTALGLPLEAGNVGSDGLGSGKPAELRFALLKLAIKANQRRLSNQFVERVVRPVVKRYSPFDHQADISIEIADPLEDIGEVADLIQQVGDYMTNDEIRRKLDMPEPEDDEIGDSYRNPADIESPEDGGGPFGGGGGLFRDGADGRTLQEVPDNAVSISDRSEAPEGANVITGPDGGLYYIPGGGGGGGEQTGDVVDSLADDLPDEYSPDNLDAISDAAENAAENGELYTDIVATVEASVEGMDAEASRTVRQQAYINRTQTAEIGGEQVEVSPVIKDAFGRGDSDVKEASLDQLGDVADDVRPVFSDWRDERGGSLLNSGTAELWGAAIDSTGNDNVPDDAATSADTVGDPLPVEEGSEPVTEIGENIEVTREVLREMFGDTVPVARGVSGEFADEIREAKESGEDVELNHRALESWSTFPDHSEKFASEGDGDGVVITAEVPVDEVYGSSFTTPGLDESENEIVVAKGGSESYTPDQIHTADDEGMAEVYDVAAERGT